MVLATKQREQFQFIFRTARRQNGFLKPKVWEYPTAATSNGCLHVPWLRHKWGEFKCTANELLMEAFYGHTSWGSNMTSGLESAWALVPCKDVWEWIGQGSQCHLDRSQGEVRVRSVMTKVGSTEWEKKKKLVLWCSLYESDAWVL